MADKLWWIIDITKQYQPQFQAHVTLEAPDGERLALTLHGESARTLVHDDVIELERKPGVPSPIARSKRWVQTSSPTSPRGASRAGGVSGPSMRAKRSARHGNYIGSRKEDERPRSEGRAYVRIRYS